jgi:hypothetical protein
MTTRRIFVFGSNLSGIHGGGAARYAYDHYGAEWGVGEGLTGDCYALPTKEANVRDARSVADISQSVARFLEFAAAHPELTLHVTRVGCGLAGFVDEQIAPMFFDAGSNCEFDPAWSKFNLQSWKETM